MSQPGLILDVWYGFVGAHPHLLASFGAREDARPLDRYLQAVPARFGRWILDPARAEYDQAWLEYQHEIGLRHYRTKKNRTDDVASTELVPFRDLFLLVFPVTFTLKPFLAKKGAFGRRRREHALRVGEIVPSAGHALELSIRQGECLLNGDW